MVNPFSNPIYLLSPLVVTAIMLGLVVLVLLRSDRTFSAWTFCWLLLSIALVSLLLFRMRSSPDVHRALPWDRAVAIGAFAIFLFYYHFTLAYANRAGRRGILYAAYSLLVVAAVLGPTDLFVEEVRLGDYGYTPIAGTLAPPLFLIYVSLIGGGLHNLARGYKASLSSEEKNRLTYLAVAGLFPLIGGFLDAFFALPPASMWAHLAFGALCTVAVLKYHLLDIRIIIRKSLIYLIVSLIVALPYVALLYFVHFVFAPVLAPWWAHTTTILLLAVFLRPLYSRAQQLVDRWFYRERYDYLKALEQLASESQFVTNLTELASTTVSVLSGAMQTPRVFLLLLSERKSSFTMAASSTSESPPSEAVLRSRSPLVEWLALHGEIISSRKLDVIPQLQSFSHVEKSVLERMGAELYVPIRTREDRLSGILVLGKKLSEQPFSTEDERLLTAVSNQMAMAIENARLYQETKQSEKELREKEREYRELAESFTDIFFAMDRQLRYTYWNKASEQVTGILAQNAVGKHLCDIFPDTEATRRAEQMYLEVIKTKQPRYFVVEYRIRNSDFVFEINAYPTNAGLSVFARDITERKLAEEREKKLQQKLSFSARLASVGELAAGVAHEINNPLTGILGFSQRLLRRGTDPTSKRDLERIYYEASRAAKVVQNLLAFARRMEPKTDLVNINAIVEKAIEMRIYELKTSNVEVLTDLAPHLPEIKADFQQIQQVFLNMIMNAEQAMTEANKGGRLTVKTEVENGYVRVAFVDSGPGIPDENLDKLFDPFFTTRAEKGGTGLGLSICHGIVSEHNGSVYVRSKLGEGATFIVELPIMTQEGSQNEVAKEERTRTTFENSA